MQMVDIAKVIKKNTFAFKLSIVIFILVSCLSIPGLFLPQQTFGIFFWNIIDKISAIGGILGLVALLNSWITFQH